MGKITNYLGEMICKHLNDYGIVVWFDPAKQYQNILETIDIDQADLFIFTESFFELRRQLEPLLDGMEPPKVLVYIPKDKSETENALIELEKAGCILTPGHPSINQNTRLEVVARAVLKPIMPDSVENICKQIASGSLTLDDVEKIAEQGAEIGSGAIKLIFESIDPVEIALRFLNQPNLDESIIIKNAMPELILILNTSYGSALSDELTPTDAREKLKRFVLLSDFVNELSSDEIPSELSNVTLPEKETHKQLISKLASRWRNDSEYKESYITESEMVLRECNVQGYRISPERLIDSQTFISTENALIFLACEQILAGEIEDVAQLIEKRKNSFWALANVTVGMQWAILETVLKLFSKADEIKSELKMSCPFDRTFGIGCQTDKKIKKRTPSELIEKYCMGKNPWFKLDTYHRELEHRFERFDIELSVEHSLMEKVIVKARQKYTDVVGDLAEAFQHACESSAFDFGKLPLQRQIFSTDIQPKLKDSKIAYLLVDALRYEMAAELIAGLGEDFDVIIEPAVATIPAITEIGMASLLPDAEIKLALETPSKGKLGLNVSGKTISSRQDRIKYLSAKLNVTFAETKLDALLKPLKKLKEQVAESAFVLVTSQEIDEICEQGNVTLARRIMGDILAQIRRGIINLAELGVENFVLTADHGYLFLEQLESGNKVDAPGGKTIDLHQRAWIGNGGDASSSYIRIGESDIGFSGNYELAFPRGISCFKVKGSDNPYFHGGISLQEMVIPLIKIKKQSKTASRIAPSDFELIMEKKKITTRFFSVQAAWQSPAQRMLIDEAEIHKRVRLIVKAGGKEVGIAVQAVYGYEDGTQDIILEKDKPNHITMMITAEEITQKTVNLHLLDAETLVELAKREKIEVDITI